MNALSWSGTLLLVHCMHRFNDFYLTVTVNSYTDVFRLLLVPDSASASASATAGARRTAGCAGAIAGAAAASARLLQC